MNTEKLLKENEQLNIEHNNEPDKQGDRICGCDEPLFQDVKDNGQCPACEQF
jgi:hypothetical protein